MLRTNRRSGRLRRHMRRVLVVAAALGALAGGCSSDAKQAAPTTTAPATTEAAPAEPVAYEDPYFGWTAEIPEGWKATPFETQYKLHYVGSIVLNSDQHVVSPEYRVIDELPADA